MPRLHDYYITKDTLAQFPPSINIHCRAGHETIHGAGHENDAACNLLRGGVALQEHLVFGIIMVERVDGIQAHGGCGDAGGNTIDADARRQGTRALLVRLTNPALAAA